MAQPTQEQVSKLEAAMLEQFALLAEAAALRLGLARQFGLDGAPFLKFNAVYAKLVDKWIQREVKYETELVKKHIYGIIASGDLKREDFFYSKGIPKLIALTKKWTKEKTTSGIGFIPLLVWAAVALAGLFTAATITDDLTTTAQEKAELLEATQRTAQELGLTPEQASGIITQTQQEASEGSGLGSTVKTVGILVVLAMLGPPIIQSFTNNKK